MTFNTTFNAAKRDPRLLARLDAMWHACSMDTLPRQIDEQGAAVVDLLKQDFMLGARFARMMFDTNNRLPI